MIVLGGDRQRRRMDSTQVSATTHRGRYMRLMISLVAVLLSGNTWSAAFYSNWPYQECESIDGAESLTSIARYAATVHTATMI